MTAQLLYGQNLRLNLQWDNNGNRAQKQNILKKALSGCPSANVRPLFNSNMTKVSVLKWSHNCTRAIRSGVFLHSQKC